MGHVAVRRVGENDRMQVGFHNLHRKTKGTQQTGDEFLRARIPSRYFESVETLGKRTNSFSFSTGQTYRHLNHRP